MKKASRASQIWVALRWFVFFFTQSHALVGKISRFNQIRCKKASKASQIWGALVFFFTQSHALVVKAGKEADTYCCSCLFYEGSPPSLISSSFPTNRFIKQKHKYRHKQKHKYRHKKTQIQTQAKSQIKTQTKTHTAALAFTLRDGRCLISSSYPIRTQTQTQTQTMATCFLSSSFPQHYGVQVSPKRTNSRDWMA